ncbi:MAG: hypothetical protein BZY79_01980 [SAR202 cluster bacterium Casp-Chloro-G4]|nr:hypothetical protein [Chloroflexota bacterium]MDA1228741.1 hypothetical protein [Chloroflexota bacterium]PKB61794.1 MAG: hypothetical protein BZY79_01980 [SAR202 cluster bacterium Casp-Chloro-G4]
MSILDIFIPGRVKANLSSNLADLKGVAISHSQRDDLTDQRKALWDACCDGAADLVTQMFIRNSDKHLDWGLKGHRRKLDQPRLAAIYWWMLLYQLVILRNRGLGGLEGYDKDAEFEGLCHTAFDFREAVAKSPNVAAHDAIPWEQNWEKQVPLEAALGLYNRVMLVLGLHVDLDARISRVSLFTSASEKAYQANVVEAMARRNGSA